MTLGNDDCNNGPARPAATSPTMLDTSPTPTSIPLTLQLSKAQRLSIPGTPERKYNTENLPWRIASDLTAATCAALLVAPLITIIDKGIIENASGRRSLRASLLSSAQQLLTRPHIFLTALPFRLITALYLGTYTTANTIDTISATLKPAGTSVSGTTSGPAKFLATTSVNMSLCLYKDSKFARLFGPPGSVPGSGVVPKASYALFALRDSLTIFASFNLPPLLAPVIPLGKELEKSISRVSVAQFLAPAGIQLLSTPLHLWGLDMYNRKTGSAGEMVGLGDRMRRVRRDWLGSSFARMGRIVPAYGVGVVVNGRVRKSMLKRLEDGGT